MRVRAGVADGDDDDQTLQPGELDRRVEHVGLVRADHARDHRQVDDADVVGLAILGGPFDGGNDV